MLSALTKRFLLAIMLVCMTSGCYFIPLDKAYQGPPSRPASLDEYYSRGSSYTTYATEVIGDKDVFILKRFTIQSHLTPITVDYYDRPEESDKLILVFPVLGGRNIIADYFARYFARHGYETAVVHRNNAFKMPENFDRLEEILKEDTIRDRIVLDFFEREFSKKDFGSFGISRGGINVAITAGVDERLKHNVIVLGGTDVVQLFKHSSQGRMQRYVDTVLEQKQITKDRFFELLTERIKTDPKNLAQYLDARDTLMILGLFDSTVPFRYGQQLRAQIGNPKTVYLLADHFVGLLYTQFLHYVVPVFEHTVLPFDYVETEAMDFYERSFNKNCRGSKSILLEMVQAPFTAIGRVFHYFFVSERDPGKSVD